MTSDQLPELQRSESNADRPEMLNRDFKSSRELSSAAIESERLAQEERRRADSIQEQIRALLAQQKAAEENSKKYTKEAEVRLQAAREQSFFETQGAKQAALRHMMSDEVFTRVAGGLGGAEDREYLKAIAERRQGFDNPTDFKVLLWNAIAGTNNDFLATAARKVLDRLDKKITDVDVSAIKVSVACLDSDATERAVNGMQTSQLPTLAPHAEQVCNARNSSPPEHISLMNTQTGIIAEERPLIAANTGVEEEQVQDQGLQLGSHSHRADYETHDQHSDFSLKEEPFTPVSARSHRRTMDEIDDDDGDEASPVLDTEKAASFRQDLLHEEEAEMLSIHGRSSSPSTPSKRAREESITSKHTSQPTTAKRPRTMKDSHPTSPRIKSFAKHIEDMAKNDTLQESDFMCVCCGTGILKMKDPRIAQCLHLYEGKCLAKMRKGHVKGAKVGCAYHGCGKDVGTTANKVTVEILEGLKKKHLADLVESAYENDETEAGETKDERLDGSEAETKDDDD